MRIKSFQEAEQYLFEQIPRSSGRMFPGSRGLERTRYLLKLLGNPQESLKVIHIAGTSGKGSSAYLISCMLNALGFRVGLHLSPHVIDIRERLEVNNKFLPKEKFVAYLNGILWAIEKTTRSSFGSPTYFEILVALAFYAFVKEKVEYAVIETGLGGLYDGTNVVVNSSKVVALTTIGFDHVRILGRNLAAIAFHKAGIIHDGNPVIASWQKTSVRKVLERVARKKRTCVTYVKKKVYFRNVHITPHGTEFFFNSVISFSDTFRSRGNTGIPELPGKNGVYTPGGEEHLVRLGLIGLHQAENCSLAFTVIILLARRDRFGMDWKRIQKALSPTSFPGRFEIRKTKQGTLLIIDGAHNPQKIQSLLSSLEALYPGQKFNFLIAFKRNKDWRKMLSQLKPLAEKIILTGFFVENQDLLHVSEKPETVGLALKKIGFKNYVVCGNPQSALKTALVEGQAPLVVTGSLYLIAELYPLLQRNNL